MFKLILTVSLLLTLSLLQGANAVRCYQCKSLTDSECAKDVVDASSNVRVVDCEMVARPNTMEQVLPVTRCNKVVTSDKAGVIVSRDCHFEIVGQKPDQCTVSHSREVERCFTCKGDLCNASSAGRFVAMGVAAILAVVVTPFLL